jgi:PBP1b-binding outer membrane lipoprotein LpoB
MKKIMMIVLLALMLAGCTRASRFVSVIEVVEYRDEPSRFEKIQKKAEELTVWTTADIIGVSVITTAVITAGICIGYSQYLWEKYKAQALEDARLSK